MLLGRKQDIILGYAAPPTIAPDARIVQVDPSPAEIAATEVSRLAWWARWQVL